MRIKICLKKHNFKKQLWCHLVLLFIFFFVLKINNSFSQSIAMKLLLYYQIALGLFCLS